MKGVFLDKKQSNMKVGFANLMSDKHEMYNLEIQSIDELIIVTYTQPGNKDFMLKGNLVEVDKYHNIINYKFIPVLKSSMIKKSMIWELMESMTHSIFSVQVSRDSQQTLIIGQSGGVFPI